MALIDLDPDNWQTDYNSAERLHRSILAEVGDRGRLQRSSIAYTQATDCIRRLVGQLEIEVVKLRDSLANSSGRLTSHEMNRRRDLLDSLQRKERGLRDVVSPVSPMGGKSRSQLFGHQSGLADLGTSGWGSPSVADNRTIIPNRTGARETGESIGSTTTQIKGNQEELLAEQDAGLDMLHEIVVRQKGMGQQIFREVTTQNELIDDIGDRTDNVNARLLATTGDIRVVDRKDRNCFYWVLIILLAIAIVAVLAI